MAKEWILNSVMNRFQLNFARNVGKTSESIRRCSPRSVDEWREYYYSNVRTPDHLDELGKKLYVKITEVIPAEVEAITEDDCITYMHEMVINRTFNGYMTEIQTIYGQLEAELGVKICPAPDEWDRLYNIDFYINVSDKYIGLQIKPVADTSHISRIYQERGQQAQTHASFTERFGGNMFYIFSIKDGNKRRTQNTAVIPEIRAEIARLSS
ncbi:MAG TPA: MjaI family restriction endonuclease [Armatimonadota bacterium]|nr:MjaI family restriction endonuclease [Armatimonadota bacterium]